MGTLFRRSLAAFLPAGLALALVFGIIAFAVMDRFYGEVTADSLGAAAAGLAAEIPAEELEGLDAPGPAVEAWARRLDEASGLRITLVRPDGVVVADSRADPATMENHGGRPELVSAFAGKAGFDHRRSATLGKELFYAAVPVRAPGSPRDGPVVAALRVAIDLPAMGARMGPAREGLLAAILVLAILATLVAFLFSQGIARPLERLAASARRVGGAAPGMGPDTEASIAALRRAATSESTEELRDLGSALAAMATELDGKARAEVLASRERSAILDGMSESVVALDGGLSLRLVNRAARYLFGIEEGAVSSGSSLLEATRSGDLVAIAGDCLASGEPVERELALYLPGGERWFVVMATPLGRASTDPKDGPQPSGHPRPGEGREGLVLVLNDITRLRRLERVRTDFVANVSHELRTPIQLVKGFVETLRAGGLGAADTERYFGIIERNATRMESLIEDLLVLARLEQEGSGKLETARVELASVVAEAVEAVAAKARARGIEIGTDMPPGLSARVNEGLLVQALVNLLDNAVKYCPPGTPVLIEASAEAGAEGGRLEISVSDGGPGIPARHLPRVFERFYRIDAARSRELGGTGLGLAIVRHVALAHGGEVSVESWEGEGTRFTLFLPS